MMAYFFQLIIYLTFFLLFVFILVMAVHLLKPLRLNKKRMWSTLALKITYVGYVVVVLVLLYFILFFFEGEPAVDKPHINNQLFLVSMIIPNLAIFVRRQIPWRVVYNYFFSVFNIVTWVYLFRQLVTIDWTVSFLGF